jgi:CheY-like chemotaxis protein
MAAKTPSIILVVDDYSDNRTLLSAWLRAKGYRVVEAADGREGVLQANRANPDLILMDLAMPGLDGVEATRQIRQRHVHARSPIFAITAYGTYM